MAAGKKIRPPASPATAGMTGTAKGSDRRAGSAKFIDDTGKDCGPVEFTHRERLGQGEKPRQPARLE